MEVVNATLDRFAADLKGPIVVLGCWPALLIVTEMNDECAPKTLTANDMVLLYLGFYRLSWSII
jgi:hypothetical protein